MTREEFVLEAAAKVFLRMPSEPSPSDRQSILSCVAQCFDYGFTMDDAIRYTLNTEEAACPLDEADALGNMALIGARYPKYVAHAKLFSPSYDGPKVVES